MILVLGNICRDTSFYVGRLPSPGETVNAARTSTGLGGKGLNQAVAASNAGAMVRLVAGIGADWGEADEAQVRNATAGHLALSLVQKPGPVDCSSILVSDSGENIIVTSATQALSLSHDDVARHLSVSPADLLLLQGNLSEDLTLHAAREAKRGGARIVFNPAPMTAWARGMEGLADVLILNAQEACAWTGEVTASNAITRLHVPCAIITLGKDGCLLRQGEGTRHLPAPPTDAVDSTGAGDTFVGVFAAEWQATGDAMRAASLALRAASASVARPGALSSIPSRQDIAALRSLAS